MVDKGNLFGASVILCPVKSPYCFGEDQVIFVGITEEVVPTNYSLRLKVANSVLNPRDVC